MTTLACPACMQSFAIPETGNMQHAADVIEAHQAAHPGHLKFSVPRAVIEVDQELRDQIRTFSHDELVATLMTLCSGMYPRIVCDSAIAELARRAPEIT